MNSLVWLLLTFYFYFILWNTKKLLTYGTSRKALYIASFQKEVWKYFTRVLLQSLLGSFEMHIFLVLWNLFRGIISFGRIFSILNLGIFTFTIHEGLKNSNVINLHEYNKSWSFIYNFKYVFCVDIHGYTIFYCLIIMAKSKKQN